MGLIMSLTGKGFPTTQVISKVTGKFHELFVERDIKTPDEFHLAILDMFVTLNHALPGKHWNVPPLEKIEECYRNLQDKDEEGKKDEVLKFMKENIQANKSDNSLLLIGLATPPVAMAAKRAGEGVPQLKFVKSFPDVLFVPAATLLTLVSVKFSRRLFLKHAASGDHLFAKNHQGKSDS